MFKDLFQKNKFQKSKFRKNKFQKNKLVPESGKLSRLFAARDWAGISENLWMRYGMLFTGAYLLTLAVYSYFFTTVIFTNHTLPNVWVNPYPSFKTSVEGRWFADILIFVTGGSGVQAFQMALGAGIQIVNAFLFAALLNVKGKLRIFIFAVFLSLHPAFLDYYSFTTDHISFTFGDTLALLGVLALDRMADRRLGVGLAILCFVLALATYPPKIALVATLLLIWCLRSSNSILDRRAAGGHVSAPRHLLFRRALIAAFIFVAAAVLYYLSTLATVTAPPESRNHINTLNQVLDQLIAAYPETLKAFTSRAEYLPELLAFVPMLGILLGIAAIIRDTSRGQRESLVLAILLILCFPIALQLSYIINDQTWLYAGRILSAHAYFLLFFLASAWSLDAIRWLPTALLAIMIYFFVIIGTQESNAAALKNIYEIERINRIVARVEAVTPDLYQKKFPLVVIGKLKFEPQQRLKKFPRTLYNPHVTSEAFAVYRQVEILNYFLGQSRIIEADKAQVAAVIAGQNEKRPWPAPESVYLQDGVIVVLLESYRPGIEVTWAR